MAGWNSGEGCVRARAVLSYGEIEILALLQLCQSESKSDKHFLPWSQARVRARVNFSNWNYVRMSNQNSVCTIGDF